MEDKILTIPAVALRGMTILPGMVAHFDISRDKSLRAVEVLQLKQKKVYSFLPESKTDKKIQRKKILREKICMKWGFWLWFVRS